MTTLERRVEDEWDELAAACARTPFSYPGWARAWLDAFDRAGRGGVVSVARRGSLEAIAPVLRSPLRLESAANVHTPEFELLARDETAETELCRLLVGEEPRAVTMRGLRCETAAAFAAEASRRGYRVLERIVATSPAADMSDGWPAYERGLSANHRGDVRRRRRRLREAGEVAVTEHDGTEGLDCVLAEGLAVEASGWKGRAGTAITSHDDTRRFYTSIARWAASKGMLRLALLRLDGRALAFHLDLEHRNVLYHLKGGYDESFARLSPGKLLHAAVLESAAARGVTRYELLGDAEPYKLRWATTASELRVVRAFAPTVAGTGRWMLDRVGRPVAKRTLALVGR